MSNITGEIKFYTSKEQPPKFLCLWCTEKT